ncbi:MAG: L-fuconolactonase [Paraglaciecola sp.]|jgi:L-fuconolactonase
MISNPFSIIDPHLHLFNLQEGDYAWLKPTKPPFWPDKEHINRQFTEADISLHSPLKLSGFVHIEAGFDNRQPWREIDWLEQHCQLPFRSVGYADLTSDEFLLHLEHLCLRSSVVGIRYILDEHAYTLLNTPKFLGHLKTLSRHHLSFDAQMSLLNSEAVVKLIRLLESTPELKVIINHAGWPPTFADQDAWQCWQKNLQKLAHFPQVAIKLSGWEMSNRDWDLEMMSPVLDTCLTNFDDTNLMLASNFPLCTWRFSMQDLWQNYTANLGLLGSTLSRLTSTNAADWYKFNTAD